MTDAKQFGYIDAEVKEVETESRTLRFVGTTGLRDRMGDELPVSGWDLKGYRKNPVVLWAHRYDQPPVGRAKKITKETANGTEGLVFDVEFAPAEANPMAEQLFQLAKRGFLRAVSVGFRPLKSKWIDEGEDEKAQRMKTEPDNAPGKVYEKKELLELSLVPVPANPEALITAQKKGLEVPCEMVEALKLWQSKLAVARTRELKNALEVDARLTKERYAALEETATLEDATSGNDPYNIELQISAAEEVAHIEAERQAVREELDASFAKEPASEVIHKPGWDDDPDATEIKYRVREPGRFQDGSFRRVTLQKDPRVVGVMGKLKGQDTMTLQSLRFPKDAGWTLKKAKAWLKDHQDITKAIDGMCERTGLTEITPIVQAGFDFAMDAYRKTRDTWLKENMQTEESEANVEESASLPAEGTAKTKPDGDASTTPEGDALPDAGTAEQADDETKAEQVLTFRLHKHKTYRMRIGG